MSSGEELQEEGDNKQSDMHAIDIGNGGDNDLIIAQRVKSILNVESNLQEVEFFILIDHLLGES